MILFVALRTRLGAKYMDWTDPGWVNSIDPDKLDLRDYRNCIIGQRYGNFFNHRVSDHRLMSDALGFWSNVRDDFARLRDYKLLTKEWKKRILERREVVAI